MAADPLMRGIWRKTDSSVERPIAGLKSAFRAVKSQRGKRAAPASASSVSMTPWPGWAWVRAPCRGPACLGAAVALKNCCQDQGVYTGGLMAPCRGDLRRKEINMMEAGYLKDIDVALMMHGGPDTCTDIRCLALSLPLT